MRSYQNLPILPKIYPPLNIYNWPSQNPPLLPRIISPLHFKHLYATLLESTSPSQLIPPPPLNILCDPPRIYPPLNIYMWPSQNLSLSPRIYPPFPQLCATLPESTPPSQRIPLFRHLYGTRPESTSPPPLSTTICDALRIYPSLLEYTTLFNNYVLPFQNLPLVERREYILGGSGIFWECRT